MSHDFREVIDALDDQYPPTNPAVLLAAAREAYLNGIRHREIVRILAWTLGVIAANVPTEVSREQHEAITALQFARGPLAEAVGLETPNEDAIEQANRDALYELEGEEPDGWREGQPEFNGAFER